MKTIVLAACLLIAAVTEAASVGWTLVGANDFSNGGYGLFVIGMKEVSSLEQITTLLKNDGVDAIADYAFATGTVNASGGASAIAASSGKSITYKEGGSDADNTYQAFAVIWDNEKANASWTSIASTMLKNNTTSKTFGFNNQSANLTANMISVGGTTPIPEPTSGLLLLVGGALMALRRKQK